MSESDLTVDVIVVGAGHNALITAGYLAKAGLEVAVLEAKSIIGGNTVTEELTFEGWQHDSCSSAHAVIQSNPVIRDDELGLISKYGLRYVHTEPAAVLPLEDGDAFVLHRSTEGTAAEIARFSRQDATRFVEMVGEWNSALKFALAGGAIPDRLDRASRWVGFRVARSQRCARGSLSRGHRPGHGHG